MEDLSGGKARPQAHMRHTPRVRHTGALPGVHTQAIQQPLPSPPQQRQRRKSAVLGGEFVQRFFGSEPKEPKEPKARKASLKQGTAIQQAKIARQLARQESLNWGESREALASKERPESTRRSTLRAARPAPARGLSPGERFFM